VVRDLVEKKTAVGLKTICRILEINRSSYYAWLKRPISQRAQANTLLSKKIKESHKRSRGTYGAPRVVEDLKAEGYSCSRKRVAYLMRKEGIFGCARKKFRAPNTTLSNHNYPVVPRVFKTASEEDFPTASNQVWVGDITYVSTAEGWLFLTSVLDVFNRKVVGYYMSDHLRSENAWEAMKMAIIQEKDALREGQALIAHSDRGCQYAAYNYQEKLKILGITQSMSRKGNCYDNAYAESFFHSLKVELVHREMFQTRAKAQAAIEEYIDWYNKKRRHSALGYKSPCEYGRMALVA